MIFNKVFLKENFEQYKRLLRVFSITLFYRSSVVAINFITGIVITRELMAANRGLFALFLTSLVIFNTLLNFGFNQSAILYAKKDPDKMRIYLSTNIVLSIISFFFILLSLFLFSYKFNFQSDSLRNLFILSYVIYSFSLIYRSFLMGLDKNVFMSKIDFITRLIYFFYVFILYYLDSVSVFNICLFVTLEYLVFTLISHSNININLLPLKWDFGFLKESFFLNSKLYISGVFIILIMRGDQYIIKYLFGNFNVGVYTISSTIVENMSMVTGLIVTMYIPKLLVEDDLKKLLAKANKLLIMLFIMSIGMSFIISFLSPYLMTLYFKSSNPEAILILRVLLFGFIPWSLFVFIYYIYLSIRLKKSLLIILGFTLVINFSINFYYLPKFGLIASSWASSIAYCFLFILSYIDLFIFKRNNFLKKESDNE